MEAVAHEGDACTVCRSDGVDSGGVGGEFGVFCEVCRREPGEVRVGKGDGERMVRTLDVDL